MNTDIKILKENHAGALILKDGTTINYGVIRIEGDNLIYYTGKGLRELWSPNLSFEERERVKIYREEKNIQKLIELNYVAITPLSEIERVLF